LARDARSSGDPVAAENYYQHAEHYFRLIAAAQEQFRQNQPLPRTDNNNPENSSRTARRTAESFSNFGQEPGFVPQQPQPFIRDNNIRDNNPREGQPYRDRDQQPREIIASASIARSRNTSRSAATAARDRDTSVDRLPSFITDRSRRSMAARLRGRPRRRSFSAPAAPAAWPRPDNMAAAPSGPATISIRATNNAIDSDNAKRPGSSPGRFLFDHISFTGASLDHVVGQGEQRWRHGETEGIRGLAVDDEFKLVGCSTGRSAGLAPFKILST